jgi:putative transposase
MVTAPMRRRQVAYGMKRGLSQRRACGLFCVARSALSYESTLAVKDAPAVAVMKKLAREYPRFGYRRIAILLRREGFPMSFDRAWRLWRGADLQIPKKRRRRRPASSRPRPTPPQQRHHVWAYDFVFDRCANGQILKCLTVVDEYTRECLAIDVAGRIRSTRVIDQLARLVTLHGAPRYLRSDNGGEFVSRAILKWLTDRQIHTALIDPGKPWQNGLDESFNGKFRDECLNMEWFRSRAEAQVMIEGWRQQYNRHRPHSSLNYLTPNEFINQLPNEASQQTML